MGYDDLAAGLPVSEGADTGPRAVTAFFDTDEAADMARQDLIAAGIPTQGIRMAGGEALDAAPAHPHGFWESLKDFFLPQEDRHLYAEGLRRGGFAVSVRTDSASYDRVLEILDRDGAVDMEERSAGWRDEGWSETPASAAPLADERSLTPAGGGTAGFGASMADQPLFDEPVDTSVIEPGLVSRPDDPATERRADAMAPDTAYAAAAPGLASAADPALDATAPPSLPQKTGFDPLASTSAVAEATRDRSHGRTRIRSYIVDPSTGALG